MDDDYLFDFDSSHLKRMDDVSKGPRFGYSEAYRGETKEDREYALDATVNQSRKDDVSEDILDVKEKSSFRIGDRIEARFHGEKRFYPGKIARARLNGTFDIDYDDGEKELHVRHDFIRPFVASSKCSDEVKEDLVKESPLISLLKEGDIVEARFRGKGSRWYRGTIARARSNGNYDVQYDDGDRDSNLNGDSIRKVESVGENSSSEKLLDVGMRVEARYRGGVKFYPGTIYRTRPNGTFDVNYDNGKKETGVTNNLIRVKDSSSTNNKVDHDTQESNEFSNTSNTLKNREGIFDVGDIVEAKFRGKGSRWYKGKVSRVRPNGTFDVNYDDGDRDLGLSPEAIRHITSERKQQQMNLAVGTKIEARGRGKSIFESGEIIRSNMDGSYEIKFESGIVENGVQMESIRVKVVDIGRGVGEETATVLQNGSQNEISFREGEKIEAKFRGKGKRWYKGVIAFVRRDGTYDVDYEDGDKDKGLSGNLIRRVEADDSINTPSISTLELGSKVEARYRGKGKFYPGKITRVRLNGTFDIAYDDGDKDVGISRDNIRVIEPNGIDDLSNGVLAHGEDLAQDKALKNEKLIVGTKIEARYGGKSKFYPGKISRVRLNGTFDINYDDGSRELSISRDLIRVQKQIPSVRFAVDKKYKNDEVDDGISSIAHNAQYLKTGDFVEAKIHGKGNRWAEGKISRVRFNGTYDVDYENGDCDSNLSADCVRMISSGKDNRKSDQSFDSAISKGSKSKISKSKIEMENCAIGGKGNKWHNGIISNVKIVYLYEVDYDDGDKDLNIPPNAIRVLKESGINPDKDPIQIGTKVQVLSWQDRFAGL